MPRIDEQRASTPTIDERRDPMSQVGADARISFYLYFSLFGESSHVIVYFCVTTILETLFTFKLWLILKYCVLQGYNRAPPTQFIPGVPPPRYNE